MKRKRNQIGALTLAIAALFFALPVSAQVTIGSEQAPEKNALLDLRENTTDSLSSKGLLLPRVELSSTTAATPLDAHVKGMFVYNTATANDVLPGIYYNDGARWVREIDTPFVVTLDCTVAPDQLDTISGSRIVGRGAHLLKYSVPPVAGVAYYTWTVPAGWLITAGQGNDEITVSATNAAVNGDITVTPQNSCGTGTPRTLAVTYDTGCGAMTVQGTWLRFMCYNLGATNTTMTVDQYAASSSSSATDMTIYGGFYQWGRKGDGTYEKRNSGTSTTINSYASPPAGLFVLAPNFPFSWNTNVEPSLWQSGIKDNAYDPCPAGWRVPGEEEWQSIFKVAGGGPYSSATPNTWTPVGTWSTTSFNSGYKVGDALFLPAAGNRHYAAGTLSTVGVIGDYWSSSATGAYAYCLVFTSGNVNPSLVYRQANGFSVRCVAE